MRIYLDNGYTWKHAKGQNKSENYKNFLSLNGSSSFSIKISGKKDEFVNSALLKKFSKFKRNNREPDPDSFFSSADPDPHQN